MLEVSCDNFWIYKIFRVRHWIIWLIVAAPAQSPPRNATATGQRWGPGNNAPTRVSCKSCPKGQESGELLFHKTSSNLSFQNVAGRLFLSVQVIIILIDDVLSTLLIGGTLSCRGHISSSEPVENILSSDGSAQDRALPRTPSYASALCSLCVPHGRHPLLAVRVANEHLHARKLCPLPQSSSLGGGPPSLGRICLSSHSGRSAFLVVWLVDGLLELPGPASSLPLHAPV